MLSITQGEEKRGPFLVVGHHGNGYSKMGIGTATMENKLEAPQEIRSTI